MGVCVHTYFFFQVKKQVDTKASKGRKVRYDIHQKLVNFMAPVDLSVTSNTTRQELYSSLFGQLHVDLGNTVADNTK